MEQIELRDQPVQVDLLIPPHELRTACRSVEGSLFPKHFRSLVLLVVGQVRDFRKEGWVLVVTLSRLAEDLLAESVERAKALEHLLFAGRQVVVVEHRVDGLPGRCRRV